MPMPMSMSMRVCRSRFERTQVRVARARLLPRRAKSTHHPPAAPPCPAPATEREHTRVPPPPPSVTAGPPRLVRYDALGSSSSSLVRSVVDRGRFSATGGLFGLFPAATVNALAHAPAVAPPQRFAAPPPAVESGAAATAHDAAHGAAHAPNREHGHEQQHGREHGHEHGHQHGGLAGLMPHHHHHHSPSAAEADQLLGALKGGHDRGSRITLLGLLSNVVLCAAKGVAGVYLHSAALLADAGHSLSDMFADVATLFFWKLSQRPPNEMYPHGYGKYETFGSLGVSLSLVAGAVGIGAHSYTLLLDAILPTIQQAPAALQALGQFTGDLAGVAAHDHGHAHGNVLDPRAIWFALASIGVKEWLYFATLKVAKEENSNVLEANAMHHRSDSLSSGITALAIFGSWIGFPVLDPLGGLLVAGLIGKQGFDLFLVSMAELSDRSVPQPVLTSLDEAVARVARDPQNADLVKGWHGLRATKSGVSTFVDLRLQLAGEICLQRAWEVQSAVQQSCIDAVKGVKEVRITLEPVDHRTGLVPEPGDPHTHPHPPSHSALPPAQPSAQPPNRARMPRDHL